MFTNVFLLNIVYFSVCLTSNKLYWIDDQLADVSTRFYTSASWSVGELTGYQYPWSAWRKKDQMKVSISLLTFLEFHHLCKAKLVPFISEMSNIRVKIELLLAAYYAVFSVWFKSQRNISSTIVCNSVVENLVISSSYESGQCNVRSFYFTNRFHLMQIKKQRL